jgi:hypothetical protein
MLGRLQEKKHSRSMPPTRDEVFTPEGKKISKKRFLNKFLYPYKGFVDAKTFHERVDGDNLILCESIFSKRQMHQCSPGEYVADPVLRHIILFVNDSSISYFFHDRLLINPEELILEFSQKKTINEYSKFHRYVEKMNKPVLRAAEEFLVKIVIEHEASLCKTNIQAIPCHGTPEEHAEWEESPQTPTAADVFPSESATGRQLEPPPEPRPIRRNRSRSISLKESLLTLQRTASHVERYKEGEINVDALLHELDHEMSFLAQTKERVFERYLNRLT